MKYNVAKNAYRPFSRQLLCDFGHPRLHHRPGETMTKKIFYTFTAQSRNREKTGSAPPFLPDPYGILLGSNPVSYR